jgi:hypothetical protein
MFALVQNPAFGLLRTARSCQLSRQESGLTSRTVRFCTSILAKVAAVIEDDVTIGQASALLNRAAGAVRSPPAPSTPPPSIDTAAPRAERYQIVSAACEIPGARRTNPGGSHYQCESPYIAHRRASCRMLHVGNRQQKSNSRSQPQNWPPASHL